MKKKNLRYLAFTGITTALLASAPLAAADKPSKATTADSTLSKMEDAEGGNYGYHLYTEDELLLELDANGVKLYKSLSPEGQRLARLVASQRCDGQNECKGLGVAKNNCAGKNSCKGEGKCAIADKNLAVKLVADKMAKKREEALKK